MHIFSFKLSELQQEVWREFFAVTADGLVKDLGLDAVDRREIGVEDHAFTADRVDDAVERNDRR